LKLFHQPTNPDLIQNEWMGRFIFFIFFVLSHIGCERSVENANASTFQHDITDDVKPWTHQNFDSSHFTFAVFADLTGGERERVFEVAVAQLNLLRPELIVNVGDLVEGGSDDPDKWHRQWDSFDERADRARAPIFYAGGNHDLTGELARQVWKECLGPRYYHFVYKNTLFLILDTEDNTPERMTEIEQKRLEAIEVYKTEGREAFAKTAYEQMPERTTGNIGEEQAEYFRQVIAENPKVQWTFVLMHKPAWEKEGEQHFSAIETALSDQHYTVFYGHTHVYHYQQRHERDYINLATTGGEQFPEQGRSMDHLLLVTVDDQGVDIANLLMAGILDKTGHIPSEGDSLIFESQTGDQ
jgi:predicted phosphodiesterase